MRVNIGMQRRHLHNIVGCKSEFKSNRCPECALLAKFFLKSTWIAVLHLTKHDMDAVCAFIIRLVMLAHTRKTSAKDPLDRSRSSVSSSCFEFHRVVLLFQYLTYSYNWRKECSFVESFANPASERKKVATFPDPLPFAYILYACSVPLAIIRTSSLSVNTPHNRNKPCPNDGANEHSEYTASCLAST